MRWRPKSDHQQCKPEHGQETGKKRDAAQEALFEGYSKEQAQQAENRSQSEKAAQQYLRSDGHCSGLLT
jgi:hypothetical protein